MSHQTGIQANDELKTYFAKCRDGQIRLLKVVIENEQLSLGTCKKQENNWEKDFDCMIVPLIEENVPCYVLFRLDTMNSIGYDWMLVSWCPDNAAIRNKMLYASTKATLKQQFGTSLIVEELHGTIISDITLDGYIKHKKSGKAPAPLTTREEELQEIKKSEVNTDVNIDSKHQTLGGVMFPITPEAKKAVQDMSKGKYDYVQLSINMAERIELASTDNLLKADKLNAMVPKDDPRYHLFKFKHTHEGDYMESIIFIYSMPGYNCTIKQRMLYSSCKGPLISTISSWGIDIAKKLEIGDDEELSEKYLYDELHPIKNLNQPKFAKPKGPPGRGPKRLTRPTE